MTTIKHLVLHVGVPKTGTSLIQRSLRKLRPQLRERGIAYVDRKQIHRLAHRRSWGAYATGPPEDKGAFASELKSVTRSEMRQTAGKTKTVVISNESLIGRVAPEFGDPYWPRAVDGVGEVIAALRPKRTDILLYTRRQDRLLESQYMQQIHLGKSLRWDRFIAGAGKDDRVRYRDLVEVLGGLPTVESIDIRPFEIIGAGAAPFVADFLASFDLAHLVSHIENFGKSNPSYTQPAWEAALLMNPHLRTPEQRDDTRKFLKQLFPPDEYPPAQLMTDEQRMELLDIYAPANESFFRDFLPGYPVDSYATPEGVDKLRTFLPAFDVASGT